MNKEKILEELDKIILDGSYTSSEQREAVCQAQEIIREIEQEDIDRWVNEIE